MWTAARTKDSRTKKVVTTPSLSLHLKTVCWNPSRNLGLRGAQTICFLAWSCNKPFSAPNLDISVCLVSLCVGATNLHSVTLWVRVPRTQPSTSQAVLLCTWDRVGFWAGFYSALSTDSSLGEAITTPAALSHLLTITPPPQGSQHLTAYWYGTGRSSPFASILDNSREPSQWHDPSKVWLRTVSAIATVLNSLSCLIQLPPFSHRNGSEGHFAISFLCANIQLIACFLEK